MKGEGSARCLCVPVHVCCATFLRDLRNTFASRSVLAVQVLPLGLQLIECQLFVANPNPTRQTFRIEWRLNNVLYPQLVNRQPLQDPFVVHKDGERACL